MSLAVFPGSLDESPGISPTPEGLLRPQRFRDCG